MSIRVTVDRSLCDSQALCTTIAPSVFAIDDDDVMQIICERPDDATLVKVRVAANSCPKAAIVLVEE